MFNRMFFNKGATRKMNRVLSISTVVHNDNIHHFIIKASLLFVGNVCVCNNRPHFLETSVTMITCISSKFLCRNTIIPFKSILKNIC